MAFVKVVEGSEIYNFPIRHFVHFYSKFWSFGSQTEAQQHKFEPAGAAP
jgi:hypothetical protein